jgi:ectoine hydroxylase-related dioxygenase (phytanoyl-CoA dioxygenase family)
MWEKLAGQLNPQTVATLRGAFVSELDQLGTHQHRYFDDRFKHFFAREENDNLLRSFIQDPVIFGKIVDAAGQDAVVQHVFPVIKPARGPKTHLHQDRDFFKTLDNPPSMSSIWVALDDVTEANGCLQMYDSEDRLLPHTVVRVEGDHSTRVLDDPSVDASKPQNVFLRAGEAVWFDSFQVHGAAESNSGSPRLALKVAVGRPESVSKWVFQLDACRNHDRRLMDQRNGSQHAAPLKDRVLRRLGWN